VTKRLLFLLFVLLVVAAFTGSACAASLHPIHKSELLTLVAGNAMPENIVAEIRLRGLDFKPNDEYRSLLKLAGADSSILKAVDTAKFELSTSADAPDKELLQHISSAGKLIRDGRYNEAADELTPALTGHFEKFEIGFVMGELLRQQERWQTAVAVYNQVLSAAPDFPEAHTKLGYVLYRSGDAEEGLRQAKAALAVTPRNAEAHKVAGLCLEALDKSDAALAEYKEALRIKPDYAIVHYDLGLFYYRRRDMDASITEYKKAIVLDPKDGESHYNLAISFEGKGDLDSAIREYREAKRLDTQSYPARHNLAAALMKLQLYAEAIHEFRDIEADFPDAEMCHLCLGRALYQTWDIQGAEKELRWAAKLDPADPAPLTTLASILEVQKKYDAALAEYRKAEELDEGDPSAHIGIGRLMLTKKNAPEALEELKKASDLAPTDDYVHHLYAQALELSGDLDSAIAELKESLALKPKQVGVMLELAAMFEKKGDWVMALNEYHQAAVAEDVRQQPDRAGTTHEVFDASKKYKEAQERFNQRLASLRKAGETAEAARLEKSLHESQNTSKATDQLDSLMQSGSQAFNERRFDDAERDYKKAVEIAEKLQPRDGRLATCLGHLGQLFAFRSNFTDAEATLERQLTVTEEIFGKETVAVAEPLKLLAMTALAAGDFSVSKKFVDRALDVDKKVYGENSAAYTEMLRLMAIGYIQQKAYDKAEPYLVQAANIEEKLYGYDPRYSGMGLMNLTSLCGLYELWGKPDKLEPCDRRLIGALDKMPGPDTHFLEATLAREVKSLRSLGRLEEAAQVEQRLKSLNPSAAVVPN
jgi:tetratricopeptide (TPR) repeat protein